MNLFPLSEILTILFSQHLSLGLYGWGIHSIILFYATSNWLTAKIFNYVVNFETSLPLWVILKHILKRGKWNCWISFLVTVNLFLVFFNNYYHLWFHIIVSQTVRHLPFWKTNRHCYDNQISDDWKLWCLRHFDHFQLYFSSTFHWYKLMEAVRVYFFLSFCPLLYHEQYFTSAFLIIIF